MPRRIVYLANSSLIGGGNRVLLGLLEELDRSRFAASAILPAEGPLEGELRQLDVPYDIIDVRGPATTGGPLLQGMTILKMFWRTLRRKADLFHAQSPTTYRLPALALRYTGVRRVCHLHFPMGERRDEVDWAFRVEPHALISCSQGVADSYSPYLSDRLLQSTHVAPNFANTEKFAPGSPSSELLAELELEPTTPVVTIVGLVSERKGHPEFLRMAEMISRTIPGIRFLVAGEDIETAGAFRVKMEEYARQLGVADKVSFLGFRPDVEKIIQLSDVIVLPSHAEGMPMSIIEAAACAKPVVAFRISGVDEVIEDGVNGRLVEEGDVPAFARVVEQLVGDPGERERLGRAARKNVEARHTSSAYTRQMEAIYDGILA